MSFGPLILIFVLPLMAGVAVPWISKKTRHTKLLLAFSGAYLVALAVLHVLPEIYEEGGEVMGRWLLAGFFLQVVLEFFSKGIEHGHAHVDVASRFPIVALISLMLHSIAEGLPFADAEIAADVPLLTGILLHKIPVAFALGAVLHAGKVKPSHTWIAMILFAIAFPAGVMLGQMVSEQWVGSALPALAVAMGMLLHISMTIIFESSSDHRFHATRFIAVVLGALLAALLAH